MSSSAPPMTRAGLHTVAQCRVEVLVGFRVRGGFDVVRDGRIVRSAFCDELLGRIELAQQRCLDAVDQHHGLLVVDVDVVENDLSDAGKLVERRLFVERSVLVVGENLRDRDRSVVLHVQQEPRGLLVFEVQVLFFDARQPVLPAFRRVVSFLGLGHTYNLRAVRIIVSTGGRSV